MPGLVLAPAFSLPRLHLAVSPPAFGFQLPSDATPPIIMVLDRARDPRAQCSPFRPRKHFRVNNPAELDRVLRRTFHADRTC